MEGLLAELRRHFKGPHLTRDEIIEAIARDSYPLNLGHVTSRHVTSPRGSGADRGLTMVAIADGLVELFSPTWR